MRRPKIAPDGNAAESPDRGAALAGGAAILSIVLASSCCLPVVPFVAAAAFAGGSAFLSTARPYLMAASILLIGFGFYQSSRARKCRRRAGVIGPMLVWISAVFAGVALLFPQAMANAAANLLPR